MFFYQYVSAVVSFKEETTFKDTINKYLTLILNILFYKKCHKSWKWVTKHKNVS